MCDIQHVRKFGEKVVTSPWVSSSLVHIYHYPKGQDTPYYSGSMLKTYK